MNPPSMLIKLVFEITELVVETTELPMGLWKNILSLTCDHLASNMYLCFQSPRKQDPALFESVMPAARGQWRSGHQEPH